MGSAPDGPCDCGARGGLGEPGAALGAAFVGKHGTLKALVALAAFAAVLAVRATLVGRCGLAFRGDRRGWRCGCAPLRIGAAVVALDCERELALGRARKRPGAGLDDDRVTVVIVGLRQHGGHVR